MKANELRLGNWYDHNGIPMQVTPNTIEEIWEAERIWCQPIPLTEEWLLKFGFEINLKTFNWNAAIGINDIGDFKLMLRFTNDFGWFYKSRCTPIKYVHQLQNLYFALTGEELTPNE